LERNLLTQKGKAAYQQRSSTLKPVFGQRAMSGPVRFLLRGVEKVGMVWLLGAQSTTCPKLWRAGWWPELA